MASGSFTYRDFRKANPSWLGKCGVFFGKTLHPSRNLPRKNYEGRNSLLPTRWDFGYPSVVEGEYVCSANVWRQLWFLRYAFRNKWITSYEFHVLGFDGCEIVIVKISLYYPWKLKLRKIVCVCCIPSKIFKMGVLQILCAPHVFTSNQPMTLTSRPVFRITVVSNRND